MSFVDDLLEHCGRLGAQPLRIPWCHGTKGMEFGAAYTRTTEFCRVGLKQVEVIHVFQGAREYEPLLFPND